MGEIKFRAWLEDRNQMYEFNENESIGDHFNRLIYGFGNYKLMQYTGLKDKNGKEIYEGDIVRWKEIVAGYETHYGPNIPTPTNAYTERYDTRIQTCVDSVGLIKGSFRLSRDAKEDFIPLNFSDWYGKGMDISDEDIEQLTVDDYFKKFGYDSVDNLIKDVTSGIEIIGNIYENPELLEESQNESK